MLYLTLPFTIHWRFSVADPTLRNQATVYKSTCSVDCSKYSLHHLFSRQHDCPIRIRRRLTSRYHPIYRYNQNGMVKSMAIYEQMTFDLMGLEKNAYDSHYGGLNEDAVLDMTIKNKVAALTRTLNQKIRYVKYMCGDMDAAAKHYDLQQELYANCAGQATNGEFRL